MITNAIGPSPFSFALVSLSGMVDASSQTSPFESLIAVERPPKGKSLERLKGLCIVSL